MERSPNATTALEVRASSRAAESNGNAYLYILVVMSFYGIFVFGLMLGYFRSKRREKRRSNIFTRLIHEEEQREWGALRKKHSLFMVPAMVPRPDIPGLSVQVCLPFHGHAAEGRVLSPLACALCSMEQSSVSSLCSSADVHFAIEEECDPGTEHNNLHCPTAELLKGTSDNSDDSADTQREDNL